MASTVVELLRRRFGGKSLPYDAEIEYLETDGNSWITTNITPLYWTDEILVTSSHTRAGTIWGGNEFALVATSASAAYFRAFQSNGSNYNNYDATIKTDYHFKNKELIVSQNGQIIPPNATYAVNVQQTNAVIWLFARSSNNNKAPIGSRIYRFYIMRDGNYLINLIPVRIGTIGYMYDKVGDTLFGNAGTGDFVLGNDK